MKKHIDIIKLENGWKLYDGRNITVHGSRKKALNTFFARHPGLVCLRIEYFDFSEQFETNNDEIRQEFENLLSGSGIHVSTENTSLTE